MTDKEKKKLLDAFDIPDPDRKKQFSDEFRKRKPEKVRKPIFPIVIRTVASAAMLALVICAITRIPKPDTEMFNDNNNVETTTEAASIETSSQTTADNSAVVTTTAVGKDKGKTTSAVQTVSTDPDKTNNEDHQTVTTEADDPGNDEPEQTEHTQKPAKTPSVRTTTTRESSHHLTTTKPAPQPQTTTVTTASRPSAGEVESGGKDMTVDIDLKYDVRDEILTVEALSSGNGIGRDGNDEKSGSDIPVDEKIREMFSDSNAVVLAKVNKIVYTSIDGEAYTAENITISEVFKGSLSPEDRITLFVSGGYIPGEEYIKHHRYVLLPDAENYSIYDSGGCAGKEYVGDTYLFFIKNSSSSFPHGSFELISYGDEAVFRQEGDSYVSMHDDSLALEISSLY